MNCAQTMSGRAHGTVIISLLIQLLSSCQLHANDVRQVAFENTPAIRRMEHGKAIEYDLHSSSKTHCFRIL